MSEKTQAPTPAAPYPVTEGVYKRLTTGLGGFTIALAACLLLAGAVMLITPRSHKEMLRTVDYRSQLWALSKDAPYQAYGPEGLPAGWRATSSRLTGLGSNPVAWHLGFVTPKDDYAALEESNENPAAFIARMTNQKKPVGTREIAGTTWTEYYFKERDQRSLVRTLQGVTLVVTGKATYEEMATLATSLKPQPKTPGPIPSQTP